MSANLLEHFASLEDLRVERNQRHALLDGEDASRIRKGNAPAIMTTIRHLCLNLFGQEPSNLRMSRKRHKAAWNDDYRAKVLFGA